VDQDAPDPKFYAMTARLLRREALRRAAEELNTTSGPGLEDMLARISAEVTAEATGARETKESRAQGHANLEPKPSPDPVADPHGA
jgi:phage shock protein A